MLEGDHVREPGSPPDRRDEAFRAAVLNGVYSAIMIHDRTGRVLDMNENMLRLYQVGREEALGLNIVDDLSAPENPAGDLAALWDRVLTGETSHFEWKARRPHDGSTFDVEVLLSRVPFQGQDALLSAVRDIGDCTQLEAERRETRKMEAVGRLAGGIAHDFNNLLTTISGYTDLLLQTVEADDPRREDLLEIRQAARKAALMTRQLLALSRHQVMRPRIMDLNDVVAAMAETLRELLGEKLELELLLDPALRTVEIDPGQMQEVLVNLALNARESMRDSGRLVIATANADEAEGQRVLLVVRDTGPAIGEDMRAHLFEPFFPKGTGNDSGLGLSTVYGIIKQSGGTITVDSEPGRGPIFRISLPAVLTPSSTATEPDPLQLTLPLQGQTILLVDDQDAVRRLTARNLRQSKYQVLEAGDGHEALKVLQDHRKVHLLLTDVVMPGMDGRELARRVTEMRPDIKVILMSGYHGQTDGETDDGVPPSAFLQKPFTQEGLLQKVRDALGG